VLSSGINSITLPVDDGEFSDQNTVIVTVEDTRPPMIICLPDIMVEQVDSAGTLVDPNLPKVFDICDPNPTLTSDPNLPHVFPLGNNKIIWTATDASGNSTTCVQNVIVMDTTPPSINSVTATPEFLKSVMCLPMYEEVTVMVNANDICDSDPDYKIIKVTSNQVGNRVLFLPQWEITCNDTVLLKAARNLFEDRIYHR